MVKKDTFTTSSRHNSLVWCRGTAQSRASDSAGYCRPRLVGLGSHFCTARVWAGTVGGVEWRQTLCVWTGRVVRGAPGRADRVWWRSEFTGARHPVGAA